MKSKEITKQIIECFKRGNKVICAGNGGSLSDCAHFAAEFVSINQSVTVLNDPVKITAIGNDYGFEKIFVMQLDNLLEDGDIFIGLSSSGKSKNINLALTHAKLLTDWIIDFPRKGNNTQEVQNYQYKLLHDIYLAVKEYFK